MATPRAKRMIGYMAMTIQSEPEPGLNRWWKLVSTISEPSLQPAIKKMSVLRK
jgi:hypothetical protein